MIGTVINEQGKSINNFDQGLTITAGGQRLTYNHQLQLAPGLYQIRVAVRDKKGGSGQRLNGFPCESKDAVLL